MLPMNDALVNCTGFNDLVCDLNAKIVFRTLLPPARRFSLTSLVLTIGGGYLWNLHFYSVPVVFNCRTGYLFYEYKVKGWGCSGDTHFVFI